jgi:hypothetical protein
VEGRGAVEADREADVEHALARPVVAAEQACDRGGHPLAAQDVRRAGVEVEPEELVEPAGAEAGGGG